MPKESIKSFPPITVDKLTYEEFVDLFIEAPNNPGLRALTQIERKGFIPPQDSHSLREFIIQATLQSHLIYRAKYCSPPNLYAYRFDLPVNIADISRCVSRVFRDNQLMGIISSNHEGHPPFEMNQFESKGNNRMDSLGICAELHLNEVIDRDMLVESVNILTLMCHHCDNQHDMETKIRFELIHQLSGFWS